MCMMQILLGRDQNSNLISKTLPCALFAEKDVKLVMYLHGFDTTAVVLGERKRQIWMDDYHRKTFL